MIDDLQVKREKIRKTRFLENKGFKDLKLIKKQKIMDSKSD